MNVDGDDDDINNHDYDAGAGFILISQHTVMTLVSSNQKDINMIMSFVIPSPCAIMTGIWVLDSLYENHATSAIKTITSITMMM